jgi:2-succinyl-6-hydroxy-2,4-cyclohexadiene-1-carboxylate synthase
MGTGEDWLPIIENLQQDFYCLLPDLPGHGATPLDATPGYESWSVSLREVLSDHGIERSCLVGYSLGGRLALCFTLTYPDLVSRLVLESANPGLSNPGERQQRFAQDTALSVRILQEGLKSFVNFWYELPLFDSLDRHPDLKAELSKKRTLQSPKSMATVLQTLSPGRQPNLWSHLSELQVPTLLITGRLDHKYSVIIHDMSQVIPNTNLVLFKECGHNVHRECPTGYVEELRDWLVKTAEN